MEIVRCFVCVALGDEARRSLEIYVSGLRKCAPSIRWVSVAALHVTLKFCGEIPVETVERLSENYAGALRNVRPFRLSLEGLGCFPDLHRPTVLWIGIREGLENLVSLYDRVERASVSSGIAPEKRSFSPHLTLARIKNPKDMTSALSERIRESAAPGFSTAVSEAIFMKSRLTPDGPIYSPIRRYAFQNEKTQ